MPSDSTAFARDVMGAYRSFGLAEKSLSESVRASAAETIEQMARPMGHPAFAGLGLGERGHCDAAVAFLDLSAFTARTFWDCPDDVVRLARAVLTQLTEVVHDFGGHVLGLRGDGVFACFGGPDSRHPDVDTSAALGACAFALDATQGALNNLLKLDGLAPVQLRAGADHGRLDFERTGIAGTSEVNVIGFAANFAAKCEKTANSWELVVGAGLADLIPDKSLLVEHSNSPKVYQRDYQKKTYAFYDFRWRSLLPELQGTREDLAGAPISRVRIL
ncbi:class 3 adenylate cyclase [Pseudonocardia hierapolitana]|uniref:Class 3 adenylate cyclase n=1 Tax=Pseudonocardia hierapolitana TaxID=1128676 RepID=A0A561SYT0_9PSEU|nr:adenylate/guanylate cyclase domain-containing protein [Pseudonocardia hierapolitana]TWF80026.1 class 3 adenylate cyclase [Pseudonocardia hierapolitana]